MDFQTLSAIITKAANAIESSEKFALPIVAAKARREAKARPTDMPLVSVSNVLTKMASSQDFITREELGKVVNSFTATHSKLSSVFAEELGTHTVQPAVFARDPNEGRSLDFDYQRLADPLLSNALSGAMDKNPTEKLYSNADAQKAHRAVYASLLNIGIEPKTVDTFAGRGDILVCKATHETPKGVAHVIIPVEIESGKALMPTMFFSQAGFKDIERNDYIDHVTKTAGKSFTVDGAKLLSVLEQVKNAGQEVVNDVELAAIKVASEHGTVSIDPNAILYTELAPETPDVELPKMAATEESSFAETLGKPEGIAKFLHSDRVVEAGRSIIIRKISEMGFGTPQVKVVDSDEKKIFYAVAIGTGTGIKVPVEVSGNMVLPPTIAFADDMVTAFSKEAISDIVKSGTGGNRRALAAASPCYDLKPSELVDIAKKSIDEGNFTRAEEAINVLGEIDPVAQKTAIAYMMLNIYESGQDPKADFAQLQAVASKPVKDTPYLMNYKVFFPEDV